MFEIFGMQISQGNLIGGIVAAVLGVVVFMVANKFSYKIAEYANSIEDEDEEESKKPAVEAEKSETDADGEKSEEETGEKETSDEEEDEEEFITLPPEYNRNIRDVIVAMLGGLLGFATVLVYGITPGAAVTFLVLIVLIMIALIDFDSMYIPPELNIVLAVLGVISYFALPGGATILERAIGIASIAVPMLIIVFFIPGGFGGGDIKMMAASGILLGWKGNIVAFFIGAVIGGLYGVVMMIARKKGRKSHFAFGPFLSVGIAASMFANLGINLVNMYLSLMF